MLAATTSTGIEQALTEDRVAVDDAMSGFLAEEERALAIPQVAVFCEWLREFLHNGKRLRPLLCCCGWRAAGGYGPLPSSVARVAASVELFHAACLIHDDIMDASDTRRGRPAMHRRIAACYPSRPGADRFGADVAILVGDLALGWSYQLVHAAGLSAAQAAVAWPLLDAMRVQTMTGQYLDLAAAGDLTAGLDDALAICRGKTAAYTMDYPLRLGAALAGASEDLLAACSAYAIPLGEAFQLRDDLLGVFGDSGRTGKSVLDDLRSGKHTALLAIARGRADSHQRAELDALVNDPELDPLGAARARAILQATGARVAVEEMISQRYQQAWAALDTAPFPPQVAIQLRHLATSAVHRSQ